MARKGSWVWSGETGLWDSSCPSSREAARAPSRLPEQPLHLEGTEGSLAGARQVRHHTEVPPTTPACSRGAGAGAGSNPRSSPSLGLSNASQWGQLARAGGKGRMKAAGGTFVLPPRQLLSTAPMLSVTAYGPWGQVTALSWEEEAERCNPGLSFPGCVTWASDPLALCLGISMGQIMTATPRLEKR